MRKKIIYYIALTMGILFTCICTALFWRFMNIIESEVSFVFILLYGISPVIFVALDIMLVKLGVKYGAVDGEHYLRCYIIDNVIYTVASLGIVSFMGFYEIIAVRSGGDLSGIEILFYYIGLGAVELINFILAFVFAASKSSGEKREGYMIAGIIIMIIFMYLKSTLGF